MRHLRHSLVFSAICLLGDMDVRAGLLLDFEDLPLPAIGSSLPLPTAYGNKDVTFKWSGVDGGSWEYASDAGNRFVFNAAGDSANGSAVSIQLPGGLFTFEGASFALQTAGQGRVTAEAWRGNNRVASEFYELNTTVFTFQPSNLQDIDRLVLHGTNWRMDNFTDCFMVVPEPTTVIAGTLLLLPFGISTIRRVHKGNRA